MTIEFSPVLSFLFGKYYKISCAILKITLKNFIESLHNFIKKNLKRPKNNLLSVICSIKQAKNLKNVCICKQCNVSRYLVKVEGWNL